MIQMTDEELVTKLQELLIENCKNLQVSTKEEGLRVLKFFAAIALVKKDELEKAEGVL